MTIDNWDAFFESYLGDSLLQEISWCNDGELRMKFETSKKESACFGFYSVRELNIELSFGDLVGSPMVFEAKVCAKDSDWEVVFYFGGIPNGEISFLCDKIVGVGDKE